MMPTRWTARPRGIHGGPSGILGPYTAGTTSGHMLIEATSERRLSRLSIGGAAESALLEKGKSP